MGLPLLCLVGLDGLFDRLPDVLRLEGHGGRQVRPAHSFGACRPARLDRGGGLGWCGSSEGLPTGRLSRCGCLGAHAVELLFDLRRLEGHRGPERRLALWLGGNRRGRSGDLPVTLGGGCCSWLWCRRRRLSAVTQGPIERLLRLVGDLEGHRCAQPRSARLGGLTLGRLGGDRRNALRGLRGVGFGRCGRCGWLRSPWVGRRRCRGRRGRRGCRGGLCARQMSRDGAADHRLLDGGLGANRSRAQRLEPGPRWSWAGRSRPWRTRWDRCCSRLGIPSRWCGRLR